MHTDNPAATVRTNTSSSATGSLVDGRRAALRSLVELATRSAQREAEIESAYSAADAEAHAAHERAVWAIHERRKEAEGQVQQKASERRGEIEGQYSAEVEKVRTASAQFRRRIDSERDAAERDLKNKLEQATWLAESLLEGAQAKHREAVKKAREAHEQHIGAVTEERNRAIATVNRYGQLPPEPPADLSKHAATAEPPFDARLAELSAAVDRLARLKVPNLFVGPSPYLAIILIVGLAVGGTYLAMGMRSVEPIPLAYAGGGAIVLLVILATIGRIVGRRHVREAYVPVHRALAGAMTAAKKELDAQVAAAKKELSEAEERCAAEIRAAKHSAVPTRQAALRRHDSARQTAEGEDARRLASLSAQRDRAFGEIEAWVKRKLEEVAARELEAIAEADARHADRLAENRAKHDADRGSLDRALREGLASADTNGQGDGSAAGHTPPVPFGQLRVDLRALAAEVGQGGQLVEKLPEAFALPAALSLPTEGSLLIESDRAGREEAVRTLQAVMLRLLTTLPPGRVRFTLIDPVGLGESFAAFMRLADHDEALVGSRIWTEQDQIEQRLADLTEHMETVIQKYLRNEFETIDAYNAQAGELAEPYRFLVIADFPTNFSTESIRRLESIATSGARCGVFVLAHRDLRTPLPSGSHADELQHRSVHLVRRDGQLTWDDPIFSRFPLTLDAPPPDAALRDTLDEVGVAAKAAKRVEVSFDTIAPNDGQLWSLDSTETLRVPIGRVGATRLQYLTLGRGVAQHALIAGKTGSGKSTLLHALVTNLAMWYAPDQVELYLVDFKKGVEFKTYASNALPHARAIAVESDREFGLSVLQRIDAELARRGDLFRNAGAQDLAGYRRSAGAQPMPRVLLVIDEFQEFFSEDDKLAQEAGLLLDRLVRQGRAFGVHVLLGSQTIGGSSGLARSTIGQMAVRVALQTSEADSQMILGDTNTAARLLSRPGEAIYNDAGGLVEANSPFQVAWLPDPRRDAYLKTVRGKADAARVAAPRAIVFEGNAPADPRKNDLLARVLRDQWRPPVPLAWIGEPVAIKDPTAIPFRRQSGAHALVVGQQENSATAVVASALLALAAQHAPGSAEFRVFDATPADSPLAGELQRVAGAIAHPVQSVAWRDTESAFAEIGAELERRMGGATDPAGAPSIYLLIHGLQRYRALRRQEESFGGFSMSDEPKPKTADQVFAEILREGPPVGIHVIAWADTPATVERTFDRNALREFDHRILFQMSASDSSNLIDSPAANKLGFHRALAYSEEQGTIEKFRPYALPDDGLLAAVRGAGSAK